jgi:hypothetical protein
VAAQCRYFEDLFNASGTTVIEVECRESCMILFHRGALGFLAAATIFHFLSWLPGAWALAAAGVLLEAAGWQLAWLGPDDEDWT